MPLDLGDQSAFFVPSLRPLPQIKQPDLNPTLGKPPHGTGQVPVHEAVQSLIVRQRDEVRYPFTVALFVHLEIGSPFVSLAYSEPKSRIYKQKIRIIAVLISCRHLIHSLRDHLKLGVFAVYPRPGILQFTVHWTQDNETLVYLPRQEKTPVRGDLGRLVIYHDGIVKLWANCLFLLIPAPVHQIILDSGLFPSPYQIVDRKNR